MKNTKQKSILVPRELEDEIKNLFVNYSQNNEEKAICYGICENGFKSALALPQFNL